MRSFHKWANVCVYVCVRACVHVCVYACVLEVMRKMLNDVLQCVYVISKVRHALGSVYILPTPRFCFVSVFVLCTLGSCQVKAPYKYSFTWHYMHWCWDSSAGGAWEPNARRNTNVGSILRCGKVFFSHSQLSLHTLTAFAQLPCAINCTHQHLCAH